MTVDKAIEKHAKLVCHAWIYLSLEINKTVGSCSNNYSNPALSIDVTLQLFAYLFRYCKYNLEQVRCKSKPMFTKENNYTPYILKSL